MGMNPIQRQKLAAFNLKGDARKWYKMQFSKEKHLYHYLRRVHHEIQSTFYFCESKGRKGCRVIRFGVGGMAVSTYEEKFISLSHFTGNIFQTEERKARMFERELRPQFRRFVISHRLHTLSEVVDSAGH